MLDPRSVEVIGDQIYVGDGGSRPAGDPLRRAIFVFDVNDLSVQPIYLPFVLAAPRDAAPLELIVARPGPGLRETLDQAELDRKSVV